MMDKNRLAGSNINLMKYSGFIFFILLCTNVSAQNSVSIKPAHFQDVSDREQYNPFVLSDSCRLFSKPDTNSRVIRMLKFSKQIQIKILNEGYVQRISKNYTKYEILKWYKVSCLDTEGYVMGSEIAKYQFRNGIDRILYIMTDDLSEKFNPAGGLRIYKYDVDQKKFLDTLDIKISPGESETRITELNSTGWKNVDILFRIENIEAYCGGGDQNIFIADANGKLTNIISSLVYGEIGNEYVSTVFLPIKFDKGKVLLIENGDVKNVFDPYTGNLHTYSFPKNLEIPKSELIVLKIKEMKGTVDKNYEPVMNPDNSYKSRLVKNATEFYRWNGNKLVRVK
jgi:hypothetical protein